MQIDISTSLQVHKSALLNIHSQQLQNNESNIYNTTKLIGIFDGIDQILTDYLTSNNDMILNRTQLNEIKQILRSKSQSLSSNHDDESCTNILSLPPPTEMHQIPTVSTTTIPQLTSIKGNLSSNTIESTKKLSYTFSKSNTYLHAILSKETASKMIDYLFSKRFIIMIYIAVAIALILFALGFAEKAYYIYKLSLFFITFICYTLWVLSLNRRVLTKSTKHFIFWFKSLICMECTPSSTP